MDLNHNNFSCIILCPDVRPLYRYSGGSGPIYSDELQCIGSETLLVNCSTGFKKACSHYNDVGVSCPSGEHFQYHGPMTVALCPYYNVHRK